jgi:hypothetical protein
MELSVLQANLISLVGTAASIALGFGAFSVTTEQIVVSSAGTLISLGFTLFTELAVKSKTQAAIAAGDKETLLKLARR